MSFREIKFRAWDNVKDKMYYVGEESDITFSFDSNGIEATDISGDFIEFEFKTLHHLEYMQYTGMVDQNDIEIYEGDILYFTEFDYNGADTQFTGVVKFANGMWQIWNSWENEFWGSDGAFVMFGIHQQDDGIEIIGNIHEHPHLLLEKEKTA